MPKERILVVDDEPATREIIVRVLERLGHVLREAALLGAAGFLAKPLDAKALELLACALPEKKS